MLANGLLRLIIAVFGILKWIGLIRLGVFVFVTVGIRFFFLLAIKWIWFGRFNARQEERREK